MKGVHKQVNDLVQKLTISKTSLCKKGMSKSLFIITKEKIKFNKSWLMEHKDLIDVLVIYACNLNERYINAIYERFDEKRMMEELIV